MLVSLQTPWGKEEAAVDAVAVLAITLHLGVPIYADEDCLVPESESAVAHSLNNAQDSVAVPPVFRDLVETLDWLPTPESEG